jgi:hypothetical protein
MERVAPSQQRTHPRARQSSAGLWTTRRHVGRRTEENQPGAHAVAVAGSRPDTTDTPADGRALVLACPPESHPNQRALPPGSGHAVCGRHFQASDPVANQGSGMSSHTSQRKPHITPIIPAIMTNPLSAQIPIGKVPAPSTISASARRRSVPSSASGVGCGPGARSLRLSARCRPRQRHVAVCVVGVVTIVGYVLAGAELRTRSGTPRRAPPKEYVCWTDRRYGEMCEPADRQPTARRHYARDVY